MNHAVRQTSRKIGRALDLIASLVYRRRAPLAPLRLQLLPGPDANPFDAPPGEPVPPGQYWGAPNLNFVLRGQFVVPADFDPARPVALYLPLGEAGDFSHPEALAYLDGEAWAAADRHHQEIALPDRCRDGRAHDLTLHG